MTDDRLDGTILAVLDGHGPLSAAALVERLANDHGVRTTDTTVGDRLRSLEQRLSVKREPDGRWTVHPDFHAPRHQLVKDAIATHPERTRIDELQRERLPNGNSAWQFTRRGEPGHPDWEEVVLHPVDPRDERPTIRIGRWPKGELERQERNQQARLTEHDADG
jgi:hypothetical protein